MAKSPPAAGYLRPSARAANAVMMGIRIPANVDRIHLRFEPFSSTRAAYLLMLLAVLLFLAAIGAFRLAQKRVPPDLRDAAGVKG